MWVTLAQCYTEAKLIALYKIVNNILHIPAKPTVNLTSHFIRYEATRLIISQPSTTSQIANTLNILSPSTSYSTFKCFANFITRH